MSNDVDFRKAASIGLNYVKDWLPGGKMEGAEYLVQNPKNPMRNLGNFKVNTVTGAWSDFAIGTAGGDAVSLRAYLDDSNQVDAASWIIETYRGKAPDPAPSEKPKEQDWEPVLPVPADAPAPNFDHFIHGTPTKVWAYRDKDGAVLMYVCRYDPFGEHKQYCPMTFCQKPGNRPQWRFKSVQGQRPIYGLDRLAARPDAHVGVVEGEKCADALQEMFPDLVIVTWSGGAGAVKRTDWSPLAGRQVDWVWPDKDLPDEKTGKIAGLEAAYFIQKALGGKPRILEIPEDKPPKWDSFDAIKKDGWSKEQIQAFLYPPKPVERKTYRNAGFPFRALGHDHGTYYFLSARSKDVIELSMKGMSKTALLALAELSWWEMEFAGQKGPNWTMAQNTLIGLCEQAGPYDPSRIRGRGAWFDDRRIVLHLGDHLMVDGEPVQLEHFDTRFIYELRPAIGEFGSVPLPKTESRKLLQIMLELPWEKLGFAHLVAGWCMTAPICSSLSWRPHLWLSGPAGSGKTWIQNNILFPALGDNVIFLEGSSTEAGIRQTLANDALPVIIDEAEGNEAQQQERLQNVLTLIREASSNSNARIAKGSPNGKSVFYSIRSSFLLSSISVGTKHHADETRISVVTLKVDKSEAAKAKFRTLESFALETITPEYCAGLRARAIKMIPVIRENAKKFASAAADVLGSQRLGDQYGTLLAGAFALEHDHVATAEEVENYVMILEAAQDEELKNEPDETRCLSSILQSQVQVETERTRKTATIGELIDAVYYHAGDGYTEEDADKVLKRLGIKYVEREKMVWFASNCDAIKGLLKSTPWSNSYSRMIKRIEGATSSKTSMRFGTMVSRAVGVPVTAVLPPSDDLFPGGF